MLQGDRAAHKCRHQRRLQQNTQRNIWKQWKWEITAKSCFFYSLCPEPKWITKQNLCLWICHSSLASSTILTLSQLTPAGRRQLSSQCWMFLTSRVIIQFINFESFNVHVYVHIYLQDLLCILVSCRARRLLKWSYLGSRAHLTSVLSLRFALRLIHHSGPLLGIGLLFASINLAFHLQLPPIFSITGVSPLFQPLQFSGSPAKRVPHPLQPLLSSG